MTVPVFIGDEITAAAYRLVGARTLVAGKGTVEKVFNEALEDAELLLITAPCAAELDSERLDERMRKAQPLVLVVPDAAKQVAPPDLDREVDRVLGIEQ